MFIGSFTGCPSLSLRSSTQLGVFVHLTRAKRDKKMLDEDPMFYCVGESLSTKSYFYRVGHAFLRFCVHLLGVRTGHNSATNLQKPPSL